MPEDQGVNGDLWNNEAAILLNMLGWGQIGDANIDVVTEEGKKRGLDRIFFFSDPRRNSQMRQAVFVEAKRYNSNNISKAIVQEWVKTLNTKLTKLKNSEVFLSTFPMIENKIIKSGLIVIWFSNASEYFSFRPLFQKMLKEVIAPGRATVKTPNHIYILDNDGILRLASLVESIKKVNVQHSTNLKFYYPTSDNFRNVIERNKILTLDFMFSKIILCEGTINEVENRFVFYFGELTFDAFHRLKSFLSTNSFLDKDKPLTIFRYQRDDEFRKIRPEVIQLFDGVTLDLKEMELFQDLPTFLRIDND